MTTAAGYISDQFEHVSVSGKGRAPLFWWGTEAPDGDASPWASAPVGAFYMCKPDESAMPSLYMKMGIAGADSDWAALSFIRQSGGSPVGLLLALTHR